MLINFSGCDNCQHKDQGGEEVTERWVFICCIEYWYDNAIIISGWNSWELISYLQLQEAKIIYLLSNRYIWQLNIQYTYKKS